MSKRAIFWFRRDLRLADNPALLACLDEADEVIPLFILDDEISERAGEHRRAFLANSLRALKESLGGALHVISGNPVEVLSNLMKQYETTSIHSAFPFAPYGNARDEELRSAGIKLEQLQEEFSKGMEPLIRSTHRFIEHG
jgi:deoxyribodipyrimidine photo-lyase